MWQQLTYFLPLPELQQLHHTVEETNLAGTWRPEGTAGPCSFLWLMFSINQISGTRKSLSVRKWYFKWDLYSFGYVPVKARAQVSIQPAKNLNSLLSQDKHTNLIKCLKESNLLPEAFQVAITEPKHLKTKTLLFFLSYSTNPQVPQLWKILTLLWCLL